MKPVIIPANPRHLTHGPLGGMPPTSHRPEPTPTTKPGRHNPNVPDIIPEPVPRMTRWDDYQFILVDNGYPNSPPTAPAFDIRGKIGQTVYQATYNINKDTYNPTDRTLQRRRMLVPPDPRTTAQLLNRARFGRAVQYWNRLTDAERDEYDRRGHARDPWLEGLNLWIREYARAHPTSEFEADAESLRTTGSLPPLP